MTKLNFVFEKTDYKVDTFYCIKELGDEQKRYFVEIVEQIGIDELSEQTYEVWIREDDECESRMLFGMFKKDISKEDFIELAKHAIMTGH